VKGVVVMDVFFGAEEEMADLLEHSGRALVLLTLHA
jgi:hypothetical protein